MAVGDIADFFGFFRNVSNFPISPKFGAGSSFLGSFLLGIRLSLLPLILGGVALGRVALVVVSVATDAPGGEIFLFSELLTFDALLRRSTDAVGDIAIIGRRI